MPEIQSKLLKINFTKGRKYSIDTVVIHVAEGTMAGMRSWFNSSASKVSSTYGVSLKGEIEQYVKEEDTHWANGRVFEPTAAIVIARPRINPNQYTISIEHEGDGKRDMTPAQRRASAELLVDIARRRPLVKLNRKHVIRHNEIYAKKSCPGEISIFNLLEMANEIATVC